MTRVSLKKIPMKNKSIRLKKIFNPNPISLNYYQIKNFKNTMISSNIIWTIISKIIYSLTSTTKTIKSF